MKRRRPPESSQMLFRIPGNLLSSFSITSRTVPASTSTTSTPAVCLRRGAGITTLSDMGNSLHDALEIIDLRIDHLRSLDIYRFRGLQSVPRYGNNRNALSINQSLFRQLLRCGNRHTACGLRVDSFALGKELDSVNDFRIRCV